VAYDSDEGLAMGRRIAAFLTEQAHAASVALGERRGSFPAFAESVWPGRGVRALRNATVTCVAPTGTLSLLAGISSGIEPFFALAMARRALDGQRFVEVNRVLLTALRPLGSVGEMALAAIREHGSIRALEALPADLRRSFPIALEIAPQYHLRMQAAFQAHVDAAVSKTVNLPPDASRNAVRDVYLAAHRLSLKGITVYRYGSHPAQTLSLVHDEPRHDCRECAV
jgi:ribonucleoside-diphosphate reductase alpha chain